ncbi:MAG: zinc ribbon-containing protein [Pontibacterium sp.]
MTHSHRTDDIKVSEAFQRLLHHTLAQVQHSEQVTRESLQSTLDEAVELELAAEELTKAELSLLAQYVKRDFSQMGYYLHESGEGLASWLNFDINVLEETLRQGLLALADNTRVDMEILRERLDAGEMLYMTGEFATPGVFGCCACGAETSLLAPRKISTCDNCGSDQFYRSTYK